jgi:cytochrome c oxidase subunit III
MTAAVLSGPVRRSNGRVPAVPSEVLGMLIFVLTEVMFFLALISAFLVIRAQVFGTWAPPGELKLPVLMTAFNTAVLLISGVLMVLATKAFAKPDGKARGQVLLGQAILFGAFFVGVQGYEWVKLIRYGMTMTSGIFGATFYLLIGSHGLHALAAIVAMGWMLFKMRKGWLVSVNGMRAMAIFWLFVVGIWPVLYGLVYFA